MADPVDQFLAEVRAEVARSRSSETRTAPTMVALTHSVGAIAQALLSGKASALRSEAVKAGALVVRIALDGEASIAAARTTTPTMRRGAPRPIDRVRAGREL